MESHKKINASQHGENKRHIESLSLPLEILFYLLSIIAEYGTVHDLMRLRALSHVFRAEIDVRMIPAMVSQASSRKLIDLLYQAPIQIGVELAKMFRESDQYLRLKHQANKLQEEETTTVGEILDFACLALCINQIYDLQYNVIGVMKAEAVLKFYESKQALIQARANKNNWLQQLVRPIECWLVVNQCRCKTPVIELMIEKLATQKTMNIEDIEFLVKCAPIKLKSAKQSVEKDNQVKRRLAEFIREVYLKNENIFAALIDLNKSIQRLRAEKRRLEYIYVMLEIIYYPVAYNRERKEGTHHDFTINQMKSHNERRLHSKIKNRYVNLSGLQLQDLANICNGMIYLNSANLSYANAFGLDLSFFKLKKSVLEHANLSLTFWHTYKEANDLCKTVIKDCNLNQAKLPFDEAQLMTAKDFLSPKTLASCLNEFCMMDKMQDAHQFRKSIRKQIIEAVLQISEYDIDLAIDLLKQAEKHEFFLFSSKKIKNTVLKLFDIDKQKLPDLLVSKDRQALRDVLKLLQVSREKQKQNEKSAAKHAASNAA